MLQYFGRLRHELGVALAVIVVSIELGSQIMSRSVLWWLVSRGSSLFVVVLVVEEVVFPLLSQPVGGQSVHDRKLDCRVDSVQKEPEPA